MCSKTYRKVLQFQNKCFPLRCEQNYRGGKLL
nr:MAG TPA_asm: hypothetical protein [Caudoviricetes sp.]